MDSVRRLTMRSLFLTIGLALICALQFVPSAGVGDVRATTWPAGCVAVGTNQLQCPTREVAYQACMIRKAEVSGWGCSYFPGYYLCFKNYNGGTGCGGQGSSGYKFAVTCPTGETWNDTYKVCWSAAKCLAKPPFGAQGTLNLTLSDKRCTEGCQFAYEGQRQTLSVRSGSTITIGYGGSFKPNGTACAADDDAAGTGDTAPPQQLCTPAGDGQTYCIKKDGQHCATASTGRQICWRPGETGEKTDGPVVQVRNAGATPVPPTTPPPSGDTFTPQGTAVTTDTQVSGVTITTTTANYSTTTGTNAGGSGSDAGENADGTSGSSPGGQGGSGSDAPQYDEPEVPDAPAMPWGVLPEQQEWDAGIPGSDACPVPVSASFDFAGIHQEIQFDFDGLCLLADKLKPLVIALGFLAAGFIVAGVRK